MPRRYSPDRARSARFSTSRFDWCRCPPYAPPDKCEVSVRNTTLPHRQQEHARKRQQHAAVVTGGVMLLALRQVGGEEIRADGRIERIEERTQRRALEPFHDRAVTLHHVHVDGAPDIEPGG